MESETFKAGLGRRAFAAGLGACGLTLAAGGSARAWMGPIGKPYPSYFNTVEIMSTDLKPFTKWRGALARYSKEKMENRRNTCATGHLNMCSYGDWMAFLKKLEPFDTFTQMRYVNAKMNEATYITDEVNWNKRDFWATPFEFMSRFGDCEDYAIVKYLSLKHLNFKEANLRVVALKDLNLRVGHAILIVFHKHPKTGEDIAWVLDNQIRDVADARSIHHYLPVFSINKNFWWRHLPATG